MQQSTPRPSTADEEMIGPADVARQFGVSVQTIYKWAAQGSGPPAYKIGRQLRYDPAEVRAWRNSHKAA